MHLEQFIQLHQSIINLRTKSSILIFDVYLFSLPVCIVLICLRKTTYMSLNSMQMRTSIKHKWYTVKTT